MKRYIFETKNTEHECHVTATWSDGSKRIKKFRNGYAHSTTSAKKWISEQIAFIEQCYEEGRKQKPEIYVDGVQVVACLAPKLSECVRLLERIVKCVNELGPEEGELFDASCDAEEVIERFKNSKQGGFMKKESGESC